MLEAQDKSSHQQYWIHTILLTDFLHEVEPSFNVFPCSPNCTHDPLWSLDGEWQLSNQVINSTLHCTLRSSEEPASSISGIRIGSYTETAEKDLCCRSSVSVVSDHFLLCFCLLLNKYQIFDTSIEIRKKKEVFYQHLKVKISQRKEIS